MYSNWIRGFHHAPSGYHQDSSTGGEHGAERGRGLPQDPGRARGVAGVLPGRGALRARRRAGRRRQVRHVRGEQEVGPAAHPRGVGALQPLRLRRGGHAGLLLRPGARGAAEAAAAGGRRELAARGRGGHLAGGGCPGLPHGLGRHAGARHPLHHARAGPVRQLQGRPGGGARRRRQGHPARRAVLGRAHGGHRRLLHHAAGPGQDQAHDRRDRRRRPRPAGGGAVDRGRGRCGRAVQGRRRARGLAGAIHHHLLATL
mmetsp:Transcript_6641/g.9882  ORF Transcript_6641/g.9882 Transcript_6641/m.9882 type:complete len:258 (+) Transcript_6641:294-1067(+)